MRVFTHRGILLHGTALFIVLGFFKLSSFFLLSRVVLCGAFVLVKFNVCVFRVRVVVIITYLLLKLTYVSLLTRFFTHPRFLLEINVNELLV